MTSYYHTRTCRAIQTFVAALLLSAGCHAPCSAVGTCLNVPSPPVVAAPDGGDLCSRACAKLGANNCIPPTSSVSACAQACADDQAAGVGSMLDPAGVLDASTVAALTQSSGLQCLGVPAGDP